MVQIPTEFQNHINNKKKYVTAYSNGGVNNTKRRNDVFKIKSYLSGDSEKDKLLYLKYNYFRLVSHRFADYEVGDGLNISFNKKNSTDKIKERIDDKNIVREFYRVAVQKSKVGYCVVRIRFDDETKQIFFERIPVTNYFANISNVNLGSSTEDIKEHNIVSFVKELDEKGESQWVTYLDSYIKEGSRRKGVYAKYKYNSKMKYEKQNLLEPQIEEDLEYLPIFIFNNDLMDEDLVADDLKQKDGIGLVSSFFGESDYVDIMDIGQDINDRQSQISVEFIKHLSSKMSLPQTFFDSVNNRNITKIMQNKGDSNYKSQLLNNEIDNFDYIAHGPGENPAQYIVKDAGMIDRAGKKIESDIRAIATLTGIPKFMLGLESASGNRHVGTDLKDMDAFLQRLSQKRRGAITTYKKIFAYVSWLLTSNYELPDIKFAKLPNGNLSEKVSIAETMRNNGFMSQESLIKFVNDFDEDEYKKEKKLLEKEEKDQVAINIPSMEFETDEEAEKA